MSTRPIVVERRHIRDGMTSGFVSNRRAGEATMNGRALRLGDVWLVLSIVLVLGAACTSARVPLKPSIPVRDIGKENLLVFVHGVVGDADTTWRNNESGAYWPDLVARDPDFNDFDI